MHLLVQDISDCTTITHETTNILINSGFTIPVPGAGRKRPPSIDRPV